VDFMWVSGQFRASTFEGLVPGLGEVLWANGLLKLFLIVYQDHHKTNPYRIIYVICLVWVRFLLLSDNC
ncbi:hypothetical protein ACSRCJ_23235, partial [Salmonella enterica]